MLGKIFKDASHRILRDEVCECCKKTAQETITGADVDGFGYVCRTCIQETFVMLLRAQRKVKENESQHKEYLTRKEGVNENGC